MDNDGEDSDSVDEEDTDEVSNDRSRNITGGSDHGEDEEIGSLLNPNEVGEMNEDLYFDENESSIVSLEFDEVSSTLRMKFSLMPQEWFNSVDWCQLLLLITFIQRRAWRHILKYGQRAIKKLNKQF